MKQPPDHGRRRSVAHFDSAASEWAEVYEQDTLAGAVYRDRMAAALALAPEPAAASRALDAGCGAGLMAVELGRRGYRVDAVDTSAAMVESAARRAREAGLDATVSPRVGAVESMPFEAASFDLVVALGVIPWVTDPKVAVEALAEVLAPGGTLLLSADNRARLNRLLDPRASPLAYRARRLKARARRRGAAPAGAVYRFHWPSAVEDLVAAAGLELVETRAIGFGPFTLNARALLSDAAAITIHRRLQSLADRGAPVLRRTGTHHLVVARKPANGP